MAACARHTASPGLTDLNEGSENSDCPSCRVEARMRGVMLELGLGSRSPSYRYFSHRGWRYCWTTERMQDGKYRAFVYKPLGKGARTGRGVTRWKLHKELHFAKRTTAKARALRWLQAHQARTASKTAA